jgi:hypothetical protein
MRPKYDFRFKFSSMIEICVIDLEENDVPCFYKKNREKRINERMVITDHLRNFCYKASHHKSPRCVKFLNIGGGLAGTQANLDFDLYINLVKFFERKNTKYLKNGVPLYIEYKIYSLDNTENYRTRTNRSGVEF